MKVLGKTHNHLEYFLCYAPFLKKRGYIVFGLSVCPKTLTLVITFALLNIATSYLACMCISWSLTF
jgi:hypothetical protein